MNLYFGQADTGTARLEDPRCPGKGLALSGLFTPLSMTPRSYGKIRHIQVCALGEDGSCVNANTSQISLGGYFDDADALPMPYCYPEAQEQHACTLLEAGKGIPAKDTDETLREIEKRRASYPQCRLIDVDVCASRVTARCGKKEVTFPPLSCLYAHADGRAGDGTCSPFRAHREPSSSGAGGESRLPAGPAPTLGGKTPVGAMPFADRRLIHTHDELEILLDTKE